MSKREIKLKDISLAVDKAKQVQAQEFGTQRLYDITQDMQDTAKDTKGSAIAAPQIGINKRIIIILGWDKLKNYPDEPAVPPLILINPTYQVANNEELICWEHCLSLPGKRGKTSRYNKIYYEGYSPQGKKISGEASGIHALVIQHELDHLDGRCFDERLTAEKIFGDIKEFEDKNIPLSKQVFFREH